MARVLLLPGVLAMIAAAPTAASAQGMLRVRDDAVGCIALRATPKANSVERGCVYAGAQVRQTNSAPYWRRIETIETPAREGWIPKKWVVEVAPRIPAPRETTIREDAWLEVHFVDVGQGDAIWIRTFDDNVGGNGRYEGKNIVIDGGPDGSDDKNQLLRYMFANGAIDGAQVDALIISHPHNDHYPGAAGILRRFDVTDYYDPGLPIESGATQWPNFRGLVQQERVNGQPTRQHIGFANFGRPDWGNEVGAQFLYAYPGQGNDNDLGSGSNLVNNGSVVLKLTYGGHSFLFMGDAEGKERDDSPAQARFVENRLLANPGTAALRSTVLKVAHHGSETSSTLPFIRAVNPEYLVVQSGRRAYSGTYLPDASTLARYCSHNTRLRILRTDQDDVAEGRTAADDQDGDHVVIRTNGRTMTVQAYSAGVPIRATTCSP